MGIRHMLSTNVDEQRNDKSLFGVVIKELGGVVFAIEAFNKSIPMLKKISNNKIYQNILNIANMAVPTMLTSYQVYSAIRIHFDNTKDIYSSKTSNISKLLGIKSIDCDDIEFGHEVIYWLTSKPKTNDFKILKMFSGSFEELVTIDIKETNDILILMEIIGKKIIIEISLVSVFEKRMVGKTVLWSDCKYEESLNIRNIIFKNFIKSFNVNNNIILYDRFGLTSRPRMKCYHNITQINMNGFVKEINNTLKKCKKRGYGLVGVPGTGKTSIILEIENQVRKYPIIYGTPTSLRYEDDIKAFFSFINLISPCILVLEDLDSYNLIKKNTRVGEFLEGMDSIKTNSSFIIIVTMNDTAGVHYSLINRRGRIDNIILIDIPKTKEEVMDVIVNKVTKEWGSNYVNEFLSGKVSERKICDKILEYKFSQADICEVFENIYINDMKLNEENILDGIEKLKKSKEFIAQCNFNNETIEDEYD